MDVISKAEAKAIRDARIQKYKSEQPERVRKIIDKFNADVKKGFYSSIGLGDCFSDQDDLKAVVAELKKAGYKVVDNNGSPRLSDYYKYSVILD